MSSLFQRVRGHSHIPERSGLDMSDFMNCSGVRPGRSSHSGMEPASGAVRSGGERVDERRDDDDAPCWTVVIGAKDETDVKVARSVVAVKSFIVVVFT